MKTVLIYDLGKKFLHPKETFEIHPIVCYTAWVNCDYVGQV